jgi:hypothetical protein
LDVPPDECIDVHGGEPQGPNTLCENVDCETEEACCFCDGGCLELKPGDCTAQGGIPQGNGTVCQPNPCITQPCCFPDETCEEHLVGTSCCEDAGGEDFGEPGQTCAEIECPDPLGQCCLPNCQLVSGLTEEECTNLGGNWGEDAVPCCLCGGCGPVECNFDPGDITSCRFIIQLPELQGEGPDPQVGNCGVCNTCTVPACAAVSTQDIHCCSPSWTTANSNIGDCPVRSDCPPEVPPGCNDNRDSFYSLASIVCDSNGVWRLATQMRISNCSTNQQLVWLKTGGNCPDGVYYPCPDDGSGLPACDEFCDTGTCCIESNCIVTPVGPAVVSRVP